MKKPDSICRLALFFTL